MGRCHKPVDRDLGIWRGRMAFLQQIYLDCPHIPARLLPSSIMTFSVQFALPGILGARPAHRSAEKPMLHSLHHVTLFRPALHFLSGRCGCASQHTVFCNTKSLLGQPLFNAPFAAKSTEFALVASDTVSRPLPEHSTRQYHFTGAVDLHFSY